MKRCPQCNRVETDDTLAFCRADGTALLSDSSSVGGEAGTAKVNCVPAASEIETSILRHVTDASTPTPTTVLAAQPASGATHALSKPKRRKAIVAITVVSALALAGVTYLYLSRAENLSAKNSIAVLPLVNTSNDPNTEYLSEGISEALINSLTELPQLRVIARSTAFRYKGKDADPQQVGRELNVQSVLMGRVRQMGEKLNIQVDLVDATTGAQLWGKEYERNLSDLLAVKQEIAREITEKLRLRISGEEQKQLVRKDTTSPEAYQLYLKGRYYWNKRTTENIRKAMEQFQQAADKDPNYALAYVGLADCYSLLEDYAGTPASETVPKAKAFAQRALQLDGSLSEAHTSLAESYILLWQWEEAEEEFKRAITLNPNYPTAHQWYGGDLLRDMGRFDESLTELKRAHELDPLSIVIGQNLAGAYLIQGDLNSSVDQSKRVIDLEPNYPRGHEWLGLAYLKQGGYSEAIVEFQKAVELSGGDRRILGRLGYGYAISGKRAEALAVLKELEGKYAKHEAIGLDLATVYAGLGDKDQAFAWLEKDFQARSGQLPRIRWESPFESLRSDPRFADLLRRMGLKP